MTEAITLCITTVWALWRPNESYQNPLYFLNAHIHMLDHSSIEHSCRHIPSPTFLLQVVETLEDDSFPAGETVSDVWQIITRVTVVHGQFSPTILTYFCRLPFNVLSNGLSNGKLLGINVLEHIIVGDGRYFSFADEHLL